VRLANALTSLRYGGIPVLRDLHDAATACIGHGNDSELITVFAMLDIGTRLGELPDGVTQTPVQDDITRELKRLKLTKYKTTVAQTIELDLRENFKVKSKEAAFIDLNRSVFFNRLSFIGIHFATEHRVSQDKSDWKEIWELRWTPEADIQAAESVLKGETVEVACTYCLKEQLEDCADIEKAAKLLRVAYSCNLPSGFGLALSALQRLASNSDNFEKTVSAAWELSVLIRYRDLRKVDVNPLESLLEQLFLRACLVLNDCAGWDDKAAKNIVTAINAMHSISQTDSDTVNDGEWVNSLLTLAFRDDKNAVLSGLSFAVLLERGLVSEERCGIEVSRRLSPGIPADIGAGWFEGMSMRNRYALLSRTQLWRELDGYISGLDADEFKRSLVFLRRAFSGFEPREKNSIAELLGEIWGIVPDDVSAVLLDELNEDETSALDGLNDFDFDF
jgi:hypothetical protein